VEVEKGKRAKSRLTWKLASKSVYVCVCVKPVCVHVNILLIVSNLCYVLIIFENNICCYWHGFAEQQTFPRNRYFGQRCVQYLKLFSLTLEMKIAFIYEVLSYRVIISTGLPAVFVFINMYGFVF